ncbi:hypothetical protein SAMN02983003_1167 [Devosia enhydra]|uniref:Uncharacterized protein n=1 Tax=Devosia enhydra TaxID=665118 RepID=A0A1K2HVU0_9HYPH|nr:hypothetical protein [Devosia enhydra]SFZ82597.1 hypothetical protein SAMN02983003_1167 [Devosia enhydra]
MRSVLLGLALITAIEPALATEWMYCGDAASEAEIGLLLPHHASVVAPIAVTLRAPGPRQWTSDPAYGDGAGAMVGQAFGDAEMLLVDVLDDNFNAPVASLRVFRVMEGEVFVQAGTLAIDGLGAWAVSCEGP